jgi:hypothetical protein
MDNDSNVVKEEEAQLPVESATTETKPVEEKVEQPEKEPEPTTEEVPKKSAEGRIRELASKVKEEKEKSESLAEKLKALTSQVDSAPQAQYTPQVEAGQEVSTDQYKTDVLRTADSLVNLRLQQERVVNRINQEAQELMAEHPELNPDSDGFNKELSDSVTEAAIAYAKSNPTQSMKTFVNKLIAPYKRAVTKEVAEQSETLAKQASEGALRPTNIKQTDKQFKDLSIEEMEKKLGIVY